MPGGGVIAAEGGAAGLAGTQVYPGTIMFDAFFTDVFFRCLNFGDGFQMRTECHNEIIYAGRKNMPGDTIWYSNIQIVNIAAKTELYMITPAEAITLQEQLRARVITTDVLPRPIRTIAGTDVEYDKSTNLIAGSVVVMDYHTLAVLAVASHCMEVTFPYIPGLFSFREMPPLLEAYRQLQVEPDLIICDGQGLAHQRRFGLACHFGVTLDKPVIGCGKTRLCGEYDNLGETRGSIAPLIAEDDQALIGNALRTQNGINPVFVSTGHKVSLATATDIVLKIATQYRLPETTRLADHYARLALLAYKSGSKEPPAGI